MSPVDTSAPELCCDVGTGHRFQGGGRGTQKKTHLRGLDLPTRFRQSNLADKPEHPLIDRGRDDLVLHAFDSVLAQESG